MALSWSATGTITRPTCVICGMSLPSAIDACERAPQDDREPAVEALAEALRKPFALACPRDRVREDPDALGQLERVLLPRAPGLEVGVSEAGEPRVFGVEARCLLEEAERHDERRERMADRGVAPVEHAEAPVLLVDVVHV